MAREALKNAPEAAAPVRILYSLIPTGGGMPQANLDLMRSLERFTY